MELRVFIDGASRGNPGEASSAAVIYDQSGILIGEVGKHLGKATNNEAEYNALIVGLEEADLLGGEAVDVFSDSELLVKQWKGIYRIKKPELQALSREARKLAGRFKRVSLTHVPRSENVEADKLANKVLDDRKGKRGSVPKAPVAKTVLRPRFIVDEQGNKKEVILDIKEYERIKNLLEKAVG